MAEASAADAVPRRPEWVGAFLALAFTSVWVGLTAATGKTYHLAPLVIAAAPGLIAAYGGRRGGRAAAVASALGLGAVALGWIAIVLAGIEPSATALPDQPGGVTAEVVAGALLGAVAGARLGRPCRSRSAPLGSAPEGADQ